MSGFGTSAFGSSPFGIGSPAESDGPPTGVAGSRYIDPLTGNYVIDDETGQFQQMPPLRQRVLLIAATQFGSSTVLRDLGIRMPAKLGNTYVNEVKNFVREAYRILTEVERSMRIDDVLVKRVDGLGRVHVTISYTDLKSGKSDRLEKTLG